MKKRSLGFTLVEILIASLLVSLVFITAASLYLTAMKFFKTASSGQTSGLNLDHRIAIATVEGSVFAANLLDFGGEFQLDASTKGYRQFKARVDNPKFTLFNKTGDDWYLYGLVLVDSTSTLPEDQQRYNLRWKHLTATDANVPSVTVNAGDPELVQGLTLDRNAAFIKIDPSASGRARIVRIQLLKDATNPQNSIWKDVAAEAMTK